MRNLLVWAFALFVSSGLQASILPPNNLHLEDSLYRKDSNVTKEEFEAMVVKFQEIYGPIAASLGGHLEYYGYWSQNIVNAWATRGMNLWYVTVYGGIARRPEMTVDALAVVFCHETGHHLAGFPIKPNSWAASEGQSDYFATHSCLTKLWKDELETNRQSREQIDPVGKAICDDQNTDPDAQNLCYRKLLASLSISKLLASLQEVGDVAFDTPDTRVVEETFMSHPHAQCRLDTYVAASLCDKGWDDLIVPETEADSANYTCTSFENYERGTRPLCWFKPGLE
jgi:hypothetical protein